MEGNMQVVHTQKRKKGVVMAITMLIAAFFFFPCSAAEFSFTGMCSITNVEAPQPPAPLPDPKLTASFNRWPEQGVAPLTVYFNETSYGNIAQWSWNFGDGATATGVSAQHTFQAPGDYTVLLTVTDSLGATNQTATIIHVIAPVIDTDGDGLPDALENSGCTKFNDADSDDDGVPDGVEDANHNGVVDGFETNPCNPDTDGDGIGDGTELGYTLAYIGRDTDLSVFQRDVNNAIITDIPVTITPVNDDPVAINDSATTTTSASVAISVLANDADGDGDALSIASFTQGGHGSVSSNSNGLLIYTSAADYSGNDFFTYTISDGQGGSATATVSVAVALLANSDSDSDGIPDGVEDAGCTKFNDADSDDDGIPDGVEDVNYNGIWDGGETDPCSPDTDGDGMQDGYELGYTLSQVGIDTDLAIFTPDEDPATTTDPLVNIPAIMAIINMILLD